MEVNRRTSQIYGYIPHPTPRNVNFNKWYSSYNSHISEMFHRIRGIVNENYPNNNIDWNNKEIYNKFVNMIYTSSSKHISNWL